MHSLPSATDVRDAGRSEGRATGASRVSRLSRVTLLVGATLTTLGVPTEAFAQRSRSKKADLERRLAHDSMGVPARFVGAVGRLDRRDLTEASGAAASTRQAGILFTINDAGHKPILYATDRTGADRGAWAVTGANNIDWESISIGACTPAGAAGGNAARCVYIGDTGDNDSRIPTRTIYRIPEPNALPADKAADGGKGKGNKSSRAVLETPKAEALVYTYPGGPIDVEAMYVAPDGAVMLVSKRERKDAAGRLRPALVFRLQPSAWGSGSPAVAQLVDSLPIVPGSGSGREITDAALSPDGRRVAVRTYSQLFVFTADPATGRIQTAVPPARCNLVPLGAGHGEGVTWNGTSEELILTNEGKGGEIHVVNCPMPARRS
jgi:hypothetical protein